MHLKLAFLFGVISIWSSCDNAQKGPSTGKQPDEKSTLHCYRYIHNKDTVILKTIDVGDNITGTLAYNLFEKDKNKGTIQGKMKGEILFADYLFTSEGILSTRQIAFKKNGESFIEGYGETESKNGKMTFKNADSLNFDHSIILSAFDCE